MPIYGLNPSLIEIGKIKIGMKGDETVSKNDVTFRKAERIDHFRVVTNERDGEDNYILNTELLKTIKEGGEAKYNKDGNLISIPIRVFYNDINLTFPHEVVSMINWKRVCSGDRKNATTRDGRKIKCPCKRLDADYTGKDKCKYSGVLSCIIEGSCIGGCHKFRTKGYNSVNNILSSLSLIKTITGGLLAFLPLQLIVTSKRTVNPTTGKSLTIHVVAIESRGSLSELQQLALDMGSERHRLIENMNEIEINAKKSILPETEDEEKEIFEEFYSDNIIPELKQKLEPAIKNEAPQEDEKVEEKKPVAAKEDPLLGKPADEMANEIKPEKKTWTHENPTELPESQIDQPAKITKDQLKIIIDLKSKQLQINDQKAWLKIVGNMKFPNVKKANDMTAEQGDKFIAYLKGLLDDNIPF